MSLIISRSGFGGVSGSGEDGPKVSSRVVGPVPKLKGTVSPVGDKSISHRAVMLASLAEGESRLENFPLSDDCLATVRAFQGLKVKIDVSPSGTVDVWGKGMMGLEQPSKELYAANSGTTARLLTGILSGQPFISTITGDESLSRRPMRRVTDPLREMGAKIQGHEDGNFLPLTVKGGKLKGIQFTNETASAQVKSAILLAGLYAEGETQVKESVPCRDHTERMLPLFGARFRRKGNLSTVSRTESLKPQKIQIPGDISSAAFFIVAGLLVPGSEVLVRHVLLNPTRTGFLRVLEKMGAQITLENVKQDWEPVGDVRVHSSRLKGVRITQKMIPSLIDELPILMVACALAEGKSEIRGAGELRFKESDRIHAMCSNLSLLGVKLKERPDGCLIHGAEDFGEGVVKSYGDHRVVMSMAVAAMRSSADIKIENSDCVGVSYPRFFEDLHRLRY